MELLEQIASGRSSIVEPLESVPGKAIRRGILPDVIKLLQENDEYMSMRVRELEKIPVNGKTVSYRTWSTAKQEVTRVK